MERMSKIKTTYIYDDETDTAELTELEEIGGLENHLLKENKKLKEKYERLEIHCNNLRQIIEDRKEENKKLKETIKDHQLYEEKLEHRIIEFEELLHGE